MTIDLNPRTRPTITVDDLAAVMGISRSSAYAGVKSGELPSVRVGRRLLVPTAAVRELLGMGQQ